MGRVAVIYLLLGAFLILAQVVVFNHIWLFGVAIPIIYIYFLICLPLTMRSGWVITFGFLSGFIVDIFSNTPGLNALCATIISTLRLPVLKLYLPREEDQGVVIPSPYTIGLIVYMKYLLTIATIYCSFYFIILSFDFFNFSRMITRIIGSSILSFLLILAFSYLITPTVPKKK